MEWFCSITGCDELAVAFIAVGIVWFAIGWAARCLYQEAREWIDRPVSPREMGRALEKDKK